jgi:hypothetical protein
VGADQHQIVTLAYVMELLLPRDVKEEMDLFVPFYEMETVA